MASFPVWTRDDNKRFELALVQFEDSPTFLGIMASFPVWTEDDHTSFKVALAQFPDSSPSFLDDIAKHLQKPVEEVTHYYNASHVPKNHRLVRWTNDDHERFVSAQEQFEGSPSFLDDIAKQLQKPLLEVQYYYDKIRDKDDLLHNPDQESDSEDDNVTETETRKRQRTQEDEDHRLDDNVLVTEASQRQRTQDQQHRLDDNVPVTEASKPLKNDGPWTPEEHRLFVEGFKKYGKGKGRLIAREFVRTRTAAQVASHAQKYYQKLKLLESTKGKQDFGKKDPPDDDGPQGSCLGV